MVISRIVSHEVLPIAYLVHSNRPFAQLLPGLETGHPVTVGQSPAYESHSEQSETETRKTAFCSSETLKSYAGD